MLWFPVPTKVSAQVARPEALSVLVHTGVPLSVKVTDPVGVGLPPNRAVKVTRVPAGAGFIDEVREKDPGVPVPVTRKLSARPVAVA
jgi:hypothetical protein